jgi:hypothetical protein
MWNGGTITMSSSIFKSRTSRDDSLTRAAQVGRDGPDGRPKDDVEKTALCVLGFPFEEVLKKGLGKRQPLSYSPVLLLLVWHGSVMRRGWASILTA